MRALLASLLVFPLAGCVAPRNASSTYGVSADGTVSRQTRSAMNGSTDAGPQEIFGLYIPFVGTGLAVKAGLEWDGNPGPIVIPVGAQAAPYGACGAPVAAPSPCAAPLAAPAPCATPMQTQMVPETYWEEERRMVPKQRMVPRQVPAVTLPIPKAPDPCHPEPVSQNECPDGCCRIAQR